MLCRTFHRNANGANGISDRIAMNGESVWYRTQPKKNESQAEMACTPYSSGINSSVSPHLHYLMLGLLACWIGLQHHAAIVTSTSTPASMLMMICLTASVGAFKLNRSSASGIWAALSRVHCGLLYEPLVYPHLVVIPRLASLSAWRFAGCDFEILGRKANRTLHPQILDLGALYELRANLLQRFDITRGKGNSNSVSLLL